MTAHGLALLCQHLACAPIRDMAIAFMIEKGMAHMRGESRAPQAAARATADPAPAFALSPIDHMEVDDAPSESGLDQIKMIMDAALASKDQYPINLEDVWSAMGYTRKDHAVTALLKLSEEGTS